jgi:hypothetical protein
VSRPWINFLKHVGDAVSNCLNVEVYTIGYYMFAYIALWNTEVCIICYSLSCLHCVVVVLLGIGQNKKSRRTLHLKWFEWLRNFNLPSICYYLLYKSNSILAYVFIDQTENILGNFARLADWFLFNLVS